MGIEKVRITRNSADGQTGLGIEILDRNASLADLLNAWEPCADDPALIKKYADDSHVCRGCLNNCCNAAFVVPDLISFKAIWRQSGLSLPDFLHRYFEPDRFARGILRLNSPCPFLLDRVCTVYPVRSLICRFYLCVNIQGATEEFIYSIVTAGVAATARYLAEQGMPLAAQGGITGYDRILLDLIEQNMDRPASEAFLRASSYQDIALSHWEGILAQGE